MKPFRFSLQPIRVLREQKEQKAQKAFGEAMRACDQASMQLRNATDELAAGWNVLCREISSGVNAEQLARSRAWCNVLELRQKERAEALQRAERAKEAAMHQMLLATRDRETIENYHDKCRVAYDQHSQREEQKSLDEVGLRRAATAGAFGASHRLNHL